MELVNNLIDKKIKNCKKYNRFGRLSIKSEKRSMVKHLEEIKELLEINQREDQRRYSEMADGCLKYKVGFETLAIEYVKSKFLINKY